MKFKSKRFWSVLMSVVMILTMIPVYPKTAQAAITADSTAITDVANLESGDYVMVNDNNFAVGKYDNAYLLSKEITEVTGDTLADLGEEYIWNITKTDNNIILKDCNGVVVKGKSKANGVDVDKTGTFTFEVENVEGGLQVLQFPQQQTK